MRRKVDLWIDLRSPYSFLAMEPAYDLERDFEAELRLRPFALNIAGAVNLNDPEAIARGMRKIKYFYLDARRFANQRGIMLMGPKKIFDQTLVHLAWLYADRSNHGRALINLAFPRFFKREIDYEDRAAVMGLLTDAGVDAAGFDAFVGGEGPADLKRHQQEAEQQGVFAVPTFVVDGELFWGQDRVDFVRAKLGSDASTTVLPSVARDPFLWPRGPLAALGVTVLINRAKIKLWYT